MTGHTTNFAPFEVSLTRHFEAPIERVFDAWTQPALLAQWWGPDSYTNPVCEVNSQTGSAIRIVMVDAEGREHRIGGTLHKVEAPTQLEFTTLAFYDEAGTPQMECYNTVTFLENEGLTEVSVHARVVRAEPAIAPVVASLEITWTQSLECLDSLMKEH